MTTSAKPTVPPKAPNLTNAPQAYDAAHQTQMGSQLRTYFQQVDTSNQQSATTLNSTTTLLWLGGF
jgi:hypothetical protein